MSNPDYETTLVELFFRQVEKKGDRAAIHVKRDGQFQATTWNELAHDVRRYASILMNYGVRPGDRVVQLSENRFEWIVTDLAIMTARAVHVPLHSSLTPEQVAWQIRDSGARVVIVSTREQAEKLTAAELPSETLFFSHEPVDDLKVGGAAVGSLRDVAGQADTLNLHSEERIEQTAQNELTPDSLATILYTSGTTGEPKGVCLTHRNLISNALGTLAMFDQQEGDLRLNFLPLSHVFARTCDLYTWIASGAELALAESRETIIADGQATRPTHLSGVPYFYDKVYRGLVNAGVADGPGVVQGLFGGRMRLLASGGAALPNHLFDYFAGQELPICQGYGLTESSPVITVNPPNATRRGSAGRAIPDVEIRIADDGEILTRGPHVMQGYWNDERGTREAIDEAGWLYTGDIGQLDDDGYLFITGRKKEIIVTAAGKNVAPVMIEALLTQDPLISQAIVIGDDRSYLTALIVPDAEKLKAEIARRGMAARSHDEALRHADVIAVYEETISRRLKGLSPHEQVRSMTLLPREFTVETGELTPKLSLRRQVIAANFADEIEAMYSSS